MNARGWQGRRAIAGPRSHSRQRARAFCRLLDSLARDRPQEAPVVAQVLEVSGNDRVACMPEATRSASRLKVGASSRHADVGTLRSRRLWRQFTIYAGRVG